MELQQLVQLKFQLMNWVQGNHCLLIQLLTILQFTLFVTRLVFFKYFFFKISSLLWKFFYNYYFKCYSLRGSFVKSYRPTPIFQIHSSWDPLSNVCKPFCSRTVLGIPRWGILGWGLSLWPPKWKTVPAELGHQALTQMPLLFLMGCNTKWWMVGDAF